jgi:hypothetical protein
MANGQGITEAEMHAEVGDMAAHIRDRLKAANKTENDRRRFPCTRPTPTLSVAARGQDAAQRREIATLRTN